ncbi:MAG TPA: RNA polymerase sigma factor [candidate division Zixibacteria bacterium]|nr:RNA polymerase sigma factor [candidate division Zixibacteria bacterium]
MKAEHRHTEQFRDIFRTEKNRVYNFALRMLGDRDCAADVTQEVFVRLFEQLRESTRIDNPAAWLIVSARNLCLNFLRSARITRLLNDDDDPINEAIEPETDQARIVRRALADLDLAHREVLILREYERFSYEEIAGILDITTAAVRNRLYKARVALREKFLSLSIARN